ncbi:MAG: hypothetical protein ABI769_16020 [Pseudomonadota bacterium]
MKRRTLIIIVAAALSIGAIAAPDASIEIMQFRQEGASSVSFMVKQSLAATLPRWNDGKGEPPLSQRKAIDIAVAELKRRNLKLETLELHSVSLTRIKELPLEGHWFYGITFSPIAEGVTTPYWKSMVLVLMDGSVINPIETPH